MYNLKWYGLIKCAILPPRKLYQPVLPVKNKVWRSVSERDYCFAGQPILVAKGEDKSGEEKLTFPLCRLCAKLNKNIRDCDHTESQRIIRGTWCTNEVEKAMEKSYKISL
jgi:hypothetical protein